MSRLIPLKASEIIRALYRLGFEKIRQKGSHVIFQHPDGRTTVIPVHPGEDIGRGLVRKILRDIELNWNDFEEIL